MCTGPGAGPSLACWRSSEEEPVAGAESEEGRAGHWEDLGFLPRGRCEPWRAVGREEGLICLRCSHPPPVEAASGRTDSEGPRRGQGDQRGLPWPTCAMMEPGQGWGHGGSGKCMRSRHISEPTNFLPGVRGAEFWFLLMAGAGGVGSSRMTGWPFPPPLPPGLRTPGQRDE